eukprot:1038419_1
MAAGTKIATMQHAAYCFDMLLEELTNVPSQFDWKHLPLGHAKMPVFVTWYKRSVRKKYDELRGCLGTFSQELPIKIGLKKYSIMSALNDKRFDPVNLSEIGYLSCSISLLHSFIRAKSWNDWELGRNGITIHFTDSANHRKTYNATYLPEVPGQQRWNKLVTIENLVSKAGFNGSASMVKNLSVTKYESCKYVMDWNQYLHFTKSNNITIPHVVSNHTKKKSKPNHPQTKSLDKPNRKDKDKYLLSSSSSLLSLKSNESIKSKSNHKKDRIYSEEEEEEEVSDNESVHSVNIKPFVEHKEEWNKNDDDDDDATHVRSNSTLEGVIAKLKAKIQEQHHTIERLETETTEMNAQNESLRTRNRTHRRRESEVFTAIGDDAKNVVQTFEELEESRKKIENDQLELAFLQAEKQRMAIAYDHQKENATKYRQESAVLKNKIKEMETSTRKRTQSRADELQTAKTRLDSLEKKAKVSENMELELAFYKAEKQRMEVKIEFQDRNQKQTKELNKELQKAVKSEKEKVRRLSQSFNVSDIEELNKLPQVQQAKEDDWKNEVDKLKEELAAEQMEKTVLQREKNDLMAKLTNVESTQAHEDEDSEEDDDGNASPLSGDENASRPEVQMAAEPPKRSEDIETLKFKLANAELQNAQLKRRVSIAGIEKEQLSQLWEQPRVTIQMVSEFIERLPLKHKEKIWARHATGQYIAKNKILHTLHSFVALCIKIKDRTAVAPSRHDIEKRLVPFADVIRQRTENANGMALDEFNNELHYWILEPVSGLIMTDGEQKQWLDEIDLLRDELMKAQEAKRRIERKSQMDLTVLLDKMKELDQDPSDQIDELEEQVEELHTIVNELQDEIKQLTVENIALRQGRDKARESEDDEEEEEEEVVPQLIDASQQKTLSEYRELQNEQVEELHKIVNELQD